MTDSGRLYTHSVASLETFNIVGKELGKNAMKQLAGIFENCSYNATVKS